MGPQLYSFEMFGQGLADQARCLSPKTHPAIARQQDQTVFVELRKVSGLTDNLIILSLLPLVTRRLVQKLQPYILPELYWTQPVFTTSEGIESTQYAARALPELKIMVFDLIQLIENNKWHDKRGTANADFLMPLYLMKKFAVNIYVRIWHNNPVIRR